MPNTLYIFVDESGNDTRGDYYGVTGCWCLSENNNFTEVLDPTVQRLSNVAEGAYRQSRSISELKGAELPSDILEAVITSIDGIAFDDTTVLHSEVPWRITHPLRYTITTINPTVGAKVLTNLVDHDLDAPVAVKSLLLISILDPLFHEEIVDSDRYDEVKVILDADVWDGPSEYVQSALDEVYPSNDVVFSTEDSKRTPGLQLADIAVYSWCRHLREGDCERAVDQVEQYRFAER